MKIQPSTYQLLQQSDEEELQASPQPEPEQSLLRTIQDTIAHAADQFVASVPNAILPELNFSGGGQISPPPSEKLRNFQNGAAAVLDKAVESVPSAVLKPLDGIFQEGPRRQLPGALGAYFSNKEIP